jgi:hypothetical protein
VRWQETHDPAPIQKGNRIRGHKKSIVNNMSSNFRHSLNLVVDWSEEGLRERISVSGLLDRDRVNYSFHHRRSKNSFYNSLYSSSVGGW